MRIGSLYGFCLISLAEISLLHPVLTSLQTVLADTEKQIDSLEADLKKAQGNEQWAIDEFIQEQAAFYREMLGIAFIAVQVEITRAVAEVRKLHDLAKRKGDKLCTTTKDRKDIMRHGFTDPAKPSPIEVIDAAANFQKHSDEWPRNWDVTPPRNRNVANTVKVLLALGIKPEDFVIYACARHLGINTPADLLRLLDHLASWRSGLAGAYKAELVRKGVHPPDGAP
jgi:hypothetical protein